MKPAKLSMTWKGEQPMIGDYLFTERGRTAYLLIEKRYPVKPGAKYTFKAICERRPRSELDGARRAWLFVWNKR